MAITIKNILITGVTWCIVYILVFIVAIGCCILTIFLPLVLFLYTGLQFPFEKRFLSTRSETLVEFEAAAIESFSIEQPSIVCEILTGELVFENEEWHNSFNPQTQVTHHTLLFYSKKNVPIQKKLIMIHGVLAQPLGWKNVIPELCNAGYAVYCPALPGFGLVSISEEVWSFRDTYSWLNYYGLYLKELIHCLCPNGERPILLGHSFGGVVCAHFCYTYPDLFKNLILINPMGLLPTLHEKTPFWAIFFNHFPFYLLRKFGVVLNCCVLPYAMKNFQDKHFIVSEIALLTCCENFGNNIASRFICVEAIKSYWEGPYSLNKLLPFAHRTHVICSFEDTISPVHASKLFFELATRESIGLYVTTGWHNPARDCTDEFICCIQHILARFDTDTDTDTKNVENSRLISDTSFGDILRMHGWSAFDVTITRNNIQKLYSSLRDTVNWVNANGSAYYVVHNGTIIETRAWSHHFIPE